MSKDDVKEAYDARRPNYKEKAAEEEMERTLKQIKENRKESGADEGEFVTPRHEGHALVDPLNGFVVPEGNAPKRKGKKAAAPAKTEAPKP